MKKCSYGGGSRKPPGPGAPRPRLDWRRCGAAVAPETADSLKGHKLSSADAAGLHVLRRDSTARRLSGRQLEACHGPGRKGQGQLGAPNSPTRSVENTSKCSSGIQKVAEDEMSVARSLSRARHELPVSRTGMSRITTLRTSLRRDVNHACPPSRADPGGPGGRARAGGSHHDGPAGLQV
jgi:hypothetical protein